MATLAMSAAERAELDAFKRDVVDPSMTGLVLAYFTAAWCGPCKQFGPILEKVAADYAAKGVSLHKLDIDANKSVAQQFAIRSVPTVYAVFQGQLVADLTPARTETQLKRALDSILAQLPIGGEAGAAEAEIEPLIAMGEEVLDGGDPQRAVGIFDQLREMAPERPEVLGGLARALAGAGAHDEAQALLDGLPAETAKHPTIGRARAAVALAGAAQPAGDFSAIEARLADPEDHEARYELAGALMATDRDRAADLLLESIRADRAWNDGAARQRLLQLFEATGLEDPWVASQRRRLSAALFG